MKWNQTVKMFDYKYLTKEHLDGFDNYKYMVIDTSPFSVYVMNPVLNNVVKIVPKWVAPNLITFIGFLLMVANFFLLSIYDYDYTAASITTIGSSRGIPDCLWPVLAVFLFVAYVLDGIDGKQARRTGTSGPLGELFDHGLDSYAVVFIPTCFYSMLGRYDFSMPPIRMYYVIWFVLLNFYLSHLEKYNTGVLYLPWAYDISIWSTTGIFLFTGLKGTSFYKQYVFGEYIMADVFEIAIYATGIFGNTLPVLYNIHRSYKLRTGKMRSTMEAIRPLWSLITIFSVCTYWVYRSPSDIANKDPRMLFLLVGTLFSNVACRLIVSQMSSSRCELVNCLLWPLVFCCGLAVTSPRLEMSAFYGMCGLALLSHLHYGTCVVRQMCEHFRINCFRIKQRQD